MLANYHTHTIRCKHAEGEDKEYVEAAIEGGMQVLGFSDHCPWIFDDGHVSGVRMFPAQLEDYFNSLEKLKKEYAKDITIYIGFESEYIPELMEAQNKLFKDYPVEYMILGQHFTSREPHSVYTGFPTTEEAFLKQYVDQIIEGIGTGKYQYVAHPDVLNYTGPAEIYERHMMRLCNYLKGHNIPVEINMLGILDQRHYTSERFLRIAKKVGNTAIIGVDAHSPDRLVYTDGHERCRALAMKYGLELVDFLPGLGRK